LGLWRYVRSLGADATTAEDVLHDALVVALEREIDDRGDAAVASFLRETARHLLLRRRRDDRRRSQLLIERADTLWHADCADDDGVAWAAALTACLEALQPKARQAVRWSYEEGRSRADIARRLEMRQNGVKTLLQRARSALRTCVERRMGEGR